MRHTASSAGQPKFAGRPKLPFSRAPTSGRRQADICSKKATLGKQPDYLSSHKSSMRQPLRGCFTMSVSPFT